jgi:hypothetical protein
VHTIRLALDGTSGQLDQHPLNTLSYCFSEKYPTQPFHYPRHVFLSLHNLTHPHRSLASSPQINAPWVFNALWYFIKVRRAEQNRVMLVACPIELHAPTLPLLPVFSLSPLVHPAIRCRVPSFSSSRDLMLISHYPSQYLPPPLQGLLPARTIAKVSVMGPHFKAAIDSEISPENLPGQIGLGRRTEQ